MSKYLFSAKEYPFYFEFKVIKRKKMKSKAMIDRKVYKSFPYGNNRSVLENMCDNSQLLTNGFKEITKEVAENMVNDAKEFEKEEWNTDEFINENAIFFKLNKDGSNQQILDRHTASIVIQNGKKTRIPSYDLVEIISKIAEVDDYDLLVGKLNGYSIINYPPTIEIFWYLFNLYKGYMTTHERLDYYYFDSQPANVMNYTTIRVPQERYLEEHDTSIWNAAPIYRDIDNRVLESDLHVALKYPSGTTYPAKVVVKGGYAIVEAEEYGTAIFVIPSKYFFTQNNELDLEMIREYKRFNHSKTVLDRVDDYIRQTERK